VLFVHCLALCQLPPGVLSRQCLNDREAAMLNPQHHVGGVAMAQTELFLQNLDDELHRRHVVVEDGYANNVVSAFVQWIGPKL